eukprot:TRINITY_DN17999_c0_g1_i1.p1 TRINITY_DN17999_c0_g1~~TRINITY_DN17999_c0_g1_i1.p1  ORF type:complete len:366 (+),score=53.61 TRINITY_DN17999_c0_g1_i1:87-1100(+)
MQLHSCFLALLVSLSRSDVHDSTDSAAEYSCRANAGNCAAGRFLKSSMGPTLIQQHNTRSKTGSKLNSTARKGVTTDCAQRLQHFSGRAAACLLLQNDRSLLVNVPYGTSPGWDFPGGNRKSSEAACETAERETFEETGIRVRAIEKLTYNVFKCEVVEDRPCRTSVDEGCLQKRWVAKNEINSLNLRGGTWGDKRGLLHQHVGSSPPPPSPPPVPPPSPPASQPDACGCTSPQGWSSTRNRCSSTSVTSDDEASRCMNKQPDACGCFPPEGWSTTRSQCSSGSTTAQDEASKCANKQPDACGCIFPEGWSTTRSRCSPGSQTDDWEGSQCSSKLTA